VWAVEKYENTFVKIARDSSSLIWKYVRDVIDIPKITRLA